jgi:hypothetical protein
MSISMGGGGLLEWDKVKTEAKYRTSLKTSDHIFKIFLYNVKESITHPSCTACCVLDGKVMQPPAPILVVWDYKWLSTLQINGWVKDGWFFWSPIHLTSTHYIFLFEITYKTKVLKVTSPQHFKRKLLKVTATVLQVVPEWKCWQLHYRSNICWDMNRTLTNLKHEIKNALLAENHNHVGLCCSLPE